MKLRLLISLFLFICATAVTALLLFRQTPSPSTRILLSNIDSNSIEHIRIQRGENDPVELQKRNGFWYMNSPLLARAKESRVAAILQLLHSQSLAQIEMGNTALQPFQLAPPLLSLQLQDYTFNFGGSDPIDARRYVAFNNTIHLLHDNLFHQLRQPATFFISNRLVAEEETINSIRFPHALVVRAGANWSLSPANEAIDKAQLSTMLASWQDAKAREVFEYRPAGVFEKIVVGFRSERSAVFDIVATSPQLILGRADLGLQYYLDASMTEALLVAVPAASE